MLARDIAIHTKAVKFDPDLLAIMITRLLKDVNDIQSIKAKVENNIENNKEILKLLEKSILMMDFNQKYLQKFLTDGTLTTEDLFNYYMGEEVKTAYDAVSKDIEEAYK